MAKLDLVAKVGVMKTRMEERLRGPEGMRNVEASPEDGIRINVEQIRCFLVRGEGSITLRVL